MRTIIFANGKIADYTFLSALLHKDDFLIAADGGTLHCLRVGKVPHLIVGDLDSLAPNVVEDLGNKGVIIERYPAEKNETDLELAIEHAMRTDVNEILLVGALGGRLDQTIANLFLMAQRQWSVPIRLVDAEQQAELLQPGSILELTFPIGSTVSAIPLTPTVTGICYSGLLYPLTDQTLHFGSTRGISNEIVTLPATVTIKSGALLIIQTKPDLFD